jgi:hypothetical protein
MSRKTIHLNRETLYELIWSRPMSEAAKQYGLSDVGLAKICRRLNIPIPGRGYWAKKEAGRAPSRPPLPALGKNEQSEVVVTRHELPAPEPTQLSESERLIAFEMAPENRITVDPTQSIQHLLVARTEKSLRAAKRDETGLVRPRAKSCLDVQVAPASFDWAARILDALAQALEARGIPLVAGDDDSGGRVTVLGVSHEVALEESTDRKVRELTPAEKKAQQRDPWLYRTPQYDYTPTGRLTLRIKGYGCGERRSWSDGKQQRLEDCLNAFIIGLIHVAVRQRAQELEWERQRREWEAEERRRREAERQRRLEEARAQALQMQLSAWQKSQQVRAYVEAVRRTAIEQHGAIEPGSDLERWLTWTREYADRLDPLRKGPANFRLVESDAEYGL